MICPYKASIMREFDNLPKEVRGCLLNLDSYVDTYSVEYDLFEGVPVQEVVRHLKAEEKGKLMDNAYENYGPDHPQARGY